MFFVIPGEVLVALAIIGWAAVAIVTARGYKKSKRSINE